MVTRFSWLVLLGCVLLQAVDARADSDAAKNHYRKGVTAYNLQKFDVALQEFQAAYEERQDPVFLYNIGQTQRNLGQYEAASKSYRAFLNQAPVLTANQRDEVGRLVNQMDNAARDERAKLPPTGTEPPSVTQPTQTAATPPPLQVVQPAPLSLERSRWFTSKTGWALGGSGIVLVAVGAGLLGSAASQHSAAVSATTQAAFDDHHSNTIRFQQIGWPLLGVGGALIVAGVTVFTLHAKGAHR
jgi:tetratricopeptide (TPR) repeat protein